MLWMQFWADQGFASNEVVYIKGLGDGRLDVRFRSVCHPRVKVAGLVVDKVDKIMHGMELGTPACTTKWAVGHATVFARTTQSASGSRLPCLPDR